MNTTTATPTPSPRWTLLTENPPPLDVPFWLKFSDGNISPAIASKSETNVVVYVILVGPYYEDGWQWDDFGHVELEPYTSWYPFPPIV